MPLWPQLHLFFCLISWFHMFLLSFGILTLVHILSVMPEYIARFSTRVNPVFFMLFSYCHYFPLMGKFLMWSSLTLWKRWCAFYPCDNGCIVFVQGWIYWNPPSSDAVQLWLPSIKMTGCKSFGVWWFSPLIFHEIWSSIANTSAGITTNIMFPK